MRGNYEKKLKLQVLIIMVLALYTTNVYATENKEYKIGEHVYYNPVSNKFVIIKITRQLQIIH